MADPMADVQVENPSSERQTTAVGDFMGSFKKAGRIAIMLAWGVTSFVVALKIFRWN